VFIGKPKYLLVKGFVRQQSNRWD